MIRRPAELSRWRIRRRRREHFDRTGSELRFHSENDFSGLPLPPRTIYWPASAPGNFQERIHTPQMRPGALRKRHRPGRNCFTLAPTASTRPEKSEPILVSLGLRTPPVITRMRPRGNVKRRHSSALMEAACTRTRISLSFGDGLSVSCSSRTSGGPNRVYRIAFIGGRLFSRLKGGDT